MITFASLSFACYNPPNGGLPPLENDTETSRGSTMGDGSGPTSGPTTEDRTTAADSSGDPTLDETGDPTTGGEGVCGDGEVDGDEVCDDGTNDGAYGGCLEDCSGPAAFCGDGEVNGPEACDDGTNDGAYGGCARDCGSLAAYCGDGVVDDVEDCDEGEDNANGQGCNVDCVTSGSTQGTYLETDLDFCEGGETTRPVFREDGNAIVTFSGQCSDDSHGVLEMSPEVQLIADLIADSVLPETRFGSVAMLGEDVLLATSNCNYVVAPDGGYTEVCMPSDRLAGQDGLIAVGAGTYQMLHYSSAAGDSVVGMFGVGSPSITDTPAWTQAPPDNTTYDYTLYAMAPGPSDSIFVVG